MNVETLKKTVKRIELTTFLIHTGHTNHCSMVADVHLGWQPGQWQVARGKDEEAGRETLALFGWNLGNCASLVDFLYVYL